MAAQTGESIIVILIIFYITVLTIYTYDIYKYDMLQTWKDQIRILNFRESSENNKQDG